MKKNVLKLVLSLLVLSAGYFMLNTTSAMTILSDGDACTAATEPCMCETTTIGDGETCTFVPPFGEIDGVRPPITYGSTCFDPDGCLFGAFVVPQGEVCHYNGAPSPLFDNEGICVDFDGCQCDGPTVLYGNYCESADQEITVDEYPTTNIVNGQTYTNSSVTITFLDDNVGVTATLNGSNISSGHPVTTNGNYTLIVIDSIGQTITATFTLNYTAPSGGGGGGGGGSSRDYCPNGDYTSSFYDNDCGEEEGEDTEEIVVTGGTSTDVDGLSAMVSEGKIAEAIAHIKASRLLSRIRTYAVDGARMRFYIPRFSNNTIRSSIVRQTYRIYKIMEIKLLELDDLSDTMGSQDLFDHKIDLYRNIIATIKAHNNYMAVIYLATELGSEEAAALVDDYMAELVVKIYRLK